MLATVAVATVAVAIAAFAGPGAAAADDDSPPIVFILDASGSMVREVSSGLTRMDVAKRATIDTIESLPDGTDLGLLVFGTGTGNSDAEREAGCSDVTTLAPLGALSPTGVAKLVDGVHESGFTPIGPALEHAAEMLPTDEPATIVLISDGVDTCAPPSSCEIASQLHRENPLLSINVVGFGIDEDEAAQQQMTCIGGVGGGTAVAASDPSQLVARLQAAAATDASRMGMRGLHGVALGMNLDEVRARVDGAVVSEPETVNGVQIIYVDCGWGTVELHDNRVYAITPADESIPTAEGISIGDSRTDVESPLGPAATTEGSESVYALRSGSSAGYRVAYDGHTGVVSRIVLCRCVPLSTTSSDIADWEISFDGFGPLSLGMSQEEAVATVPALVDLNDGGGLRLVGSAGRPLISPMFFDDGLVYLSVGTVWGVDVAPGSALPHARGIRVGDSAATAEYAYPGGSYYSNAAGGLHSYLVTDREGRVLTFWFTSDLDGREYIGMITLEDATRTLTSEAFDPYA